MWHCEGRLQHMALRNDLPVTTFSLVACDPQTWRPGGCRRLEVSGGGRGGALGAGRRRRRSGPGLGEYELWPTWTGPAGDGQIAERGARRADPGRCQAEHRQAGIVDAQGHSATWTGHECHSWAGGVAGQNFAAQGNILLGEATISAHGRDLPARKRLTVATNARRAGGWPAGGRR